MLTTVAWLHVSGLTLIGSLVYGFTCSASTPLSSAWFAVHSKMGSAIFSSAACLCAGDEIVRQPERADEPRIARHDGDVVADAVVVVVLVARTPPTRVFTHSLSSIAFIVATTRGIVGVEQVKLVDRRRCEASMDSSTSYRS